MWLFYFYVIVLKLTVKREVLKQIPKVIWRNHKASIKFIGRLLCYAQQLKVVTVVYTL